MQQETGGEPQRQPAQPDGALQPARPPQSLQPDVARSPRYCHACGAQIDPRAVVCPGCGVAQGALVPAARQHPDAVLGLILNIFIPGVGSLVIGQTQAGLIQLALLLLSIPLSFVLIGVPLAIAVWIWALVVSVQSFSNYTGPPRAHA